MPGPVARLGDRPPRAGARPRGRRVCSASRSTARCAAPPARTARTRRAREAAGIVARRSARRSPSSARRTPAARSGRRPRCRSGTASSTASITSSTTSGSAGLERRGNRRRRARARLVSARSLCNCSITGMRSRGLQGTRRRAEPSVRSKACARDDHDREAANLLAVVMPFVAVDRRDRPALERATSAPPTWRSSPSCTWRPRSASRSAITGCSPTARSTTPKPVRYTLAILGSMAVQGSVIDWVADHRKHHAFTDEDGDPHSPHGHGGGAGRAPRALARAHRLAARDAGRADKRRFAPDLLEDQGLRWINRKFPALVGLGLADPVRRRLRAERHARRRAHRRSSGAASCASSSSTTSPGASTRCATSSARRRFVTPDESRQRLLARHARRSASPGTTTTTPSRARPSQGLRWWEVDISGA